MLRVVIVRMADGLVQDAGDVFPRGTEIHITAPIHFQSEPGDTFGLSDAAVLYQEDAVKIADALSETLPGGTFDRLIEELLKREASLLAVAWGQKAKVKEGSRDIKDIPTDKLLSDLDSIVRLSDEAARRIGAELERRGRGDQQVKE